MKIRLKTSQQKLIILYKNFQMIIYKKIIHLTIIGYKNKIKKTNNYKISTHLKYKQINSKISEVKILRKKAQKIILASSTIYKKVEKYNKIIIFLIINI